MTRQEVATIGESGGVGAPATAAAPAEGVRSVRSRWRINPTFLAYLIGPPGLALVLVLMRFGDVAVEPTWKWVAIFAAAPLVSLAGNQFHDSHPSELRLHARVASGAAVVTVIIYLTGWGPVLWGGFAFLALENIANGGFRVWRVSALWSVLGMSIGQAAISLHLAPSLLRPGPANGLALMGGFILFFIIRMAGATMEEKEKAEAAARLSEDRFRSLIQNSSDVTMVMGEAGAITFVSPAVTPMLAYEPDELLGVCATDLVHPDDRDRVRDRLGFELYATSGVVPVQFRLARKDGTYREVEAVVSNQRDRPSVEGYVANLRDITERKEFEKLLAHRALHDPLTGLANRQLILDRTEQMLVKAKRTFDPPVAYFIDLDNFKDANDSLGHEAGDKILQAVARRLTTILRASDTLGRLGGDEFVILTEGSSPMVDPMIIAERVRETLRTPFHVEGFEEFPITVTASIGIATGERTSAQELLRDADIALYRAKAAGRDRCVLFESAMQSAAVHRQGLKSDLDSALANEEFFLLYQPIFDLNSIRLRGVEALLRWQHPTRGIISPDDFIPILEECGLIIDVGRWVLREACVQAAGWQNMGLSTTLSVNVSMRQLESEDLIAHVQEALSISGLDPGCLVIEVTESILMKDANATVSRLRQLKKIGVLIAIDDFGTGHSSLAYLRQFPVDVLKIDRSFIADMDGRADGAVLIHALVELGRTLGLTTIAEGIELQTQLEGLRLENCDGGQGFIFSRPVDAVGIEQLLIQSRFELEATPSGPNSPAGDA